MGKTCVICGEAGWSYYPFCREHLQMKADGKITKCEECGTWYFTNKSCPNCTPISNNTATKSTSESELTCIACGEPSNGKHFCRACYFKYKDREIEVHFKNCTESYVSDEYCNRKYTCDDGRKVRSKSEKIISDFFFKYKIRAIYEKSVFYYTPEGDTIELKPDFYLPDYDTYLEHNGLNNQSYKANKKRTQQMYEELKYQVIITTEDDLEDIERVLKPKLRIN